MTTKPQTKPPTKTQKRLAARRNAFDTQPMKDEERKMSRRPGSQNRNK